MLGSGLLLLGLFLLFRSETATNKRLVFEGMRDRLDARILERAAKSGSWRQYVGASSLRLLLHFLLHQFLGAVLYIMKAVETRLNKLRNRNRLIAKSVSAVSEDNHLSHIARHKEAVALSPEEKEALRSKSLLDQ